MDSLKNLVSSSVKSLKGLVVTKLPQDQLVADLSAASIPASSDPCRTCADPCDVGHLEYPSKLFIDTISNMVGSVKPYMRQVSQKFYKKIIDEMDETGRDIDGKSRLGPRGY